MCQKTTHHFFQLKGRKCALKVIKKQGETDSELKILLKAKEKRLKNVIGVYEGFSFENHMCIAMELADMTLLGFTHVVKEVSIEQVSYIAHQLLLGMKAIHEDLGIIHGDIKPENIGITMRKKVYIKVLDFGCAIHQHQIDEHIGNTIQSIYYRAPEVILGLPFTELIDLWSVGCVVAELRLRRPLFPGKSELEMLHHINEAVGNPPLDMMQDSVKANMFFENGWHLKTLNHLSHTYNDINDLADPNISHSEYLLNFVKELLQVDPKARMTSSAALENEFFQYFTWSHVNEDEKEEDETSHSSDESSEDEDDDQSTGDDDQSTDSADERPDSVTESTDSADERPDSVTESTDSADERPDSVTERTDSADERMDDDEQTDPADEDGSLISNSDDIEEDIFDRSSDEQADNEYEEEEAFDGSTNNHEEMGEMPAKRIKLSFD